MANLIIKELMKRKGYTTYSLAEKLGMSQSGLFLRISSNNPTINSLQEIADALEVPLVDLFAVPPGYQHWTEAERQDQDINALVLQTRQQREADRMAQGDDVANVKSDSNDNAACDVSCDQSRDDNRTPPFPTTLFCPHCGQKFVMLPRED